MKAFFKSSLFVFPVVACDSCFTAIFAVEG